jgi:large subunit ribosomal protein L13
MLPFKKPKGKTALKKLKVFISVPEDLKDQQMITLKEAQVEKLKGPYFTLAELAKEIGWNKGE